VVSLQGQKSLYGILFVSPWIVGFLTLLVIPFIQSFRISLSDIVFLAEGGYRLDWVGLNNYREMLLVSPEYNAAVIASIGSMLANVPLVTVFSLFAAILIKDRFPGRALTRAIFFLPVILGSGIVLRLQADSPLNRIMLASLASTDAAELNQQSYALEQFLYSIQLGRGLVAYIIAAVGRIRDIIAVSGVQILVFLAGLQSIPPSYYEAAQIEGATAWEVFWKITIPVISPLVVANAVYTIIDAFTAYNNETMALVRITAYGQSRYGLSAAMAWGYFMVVALMLIIFYRAVSRRVFYQN
jgi:ABC-type sugar transport system permease subunit